MEKKIEVEIDGKVIRIMPHMLDDFMLMGASVIKRQTRKVPDELLNIPKKEVLLPKVEEVIKPAPELNHLADVKMEATEPKEIKRRNTKKK